MICVNLKNVNHEKILNEYLKIRRKNDDIQKNRLKEVYQKIPRIEILDNSARDISMNAYKDYQKNNNIKVFEDLNKKIEDIKKEKSKLLKDNNFDKAYLDPIYDCEFCKDTGYVDGKKCNCYKQKQLKELYEISGLKEILKRENFNNLVYDYYDREYIIKDIESTQYEYMKKVIKICKNYIEEFDNKNQSIFFTGNPGVGKTFLSNCIAKELIEKLKVVVRIGAAELVEIIKAGSRDFDAEPDPYLVESDLLIIDDLGTELNTEWNSSSIFNIIDERLKFNKATIITTNLSYNDIRDRYSERVSSRIFSEYITIPLYGRDIRMIKKFI